MFHQILDILDGKKTIILAMAAPIITYLMATNVITNELGALLQTLLSIATGGAVYATNKLAMGRAIGTIPPKK